MNTTIAAEKLKFVEGELAKSETKVDGIKKEIAAFQKKTGFISPIPIIQDQLAKMNELEGLRIQKQIEIDAIAAKSPLNPNLEKMRNEVEILRETIKGMNERMTGEQGQKLSAILTEFTDLNRELEFALSLKQTTEALLEQTRVDAISHTRFFTTVQSPYYPEEAVHPAKEKLTITTLICSILIFSILSALTRSMFDRM
jgi:capsule polysaccharide export protein KpsE/RkpR